MAIKTINTSVVTHEMLKGFRDELAKRFSDGRAAILAALEAAPTVVLPPDEVPDSTAQLHAEIAALRQQLQEYYGIIQHLKIELSRKSVSVDGPVIMQVEWKTGESK